MKSIHQVFIVIAVSVLFTGCITGKKALQEGNYTEAVTKAVERLRENPDSKPSAATLKQAYPLVVKTATEEIELLLRSQDPRKYAGVVDRYETLNRLADEIRHCPAALKIIDRPEVFGDQLAAAREKAAPEAYDAGMNLLKQGTRQTAREAYYLFLDADRFVPGYQDVSDKISQSKSDATLKVVVEQIPVRGRYQISSEYFYDQVYSFLSSGIKQDFVEFYSPKEAKTLPYVDEILVMEFDDFIVGATNEKDSEKEYTSKDSVRVGTATVNGRKVEVYDRVKAKLTTHRRDVISTGTLIVQIMNAGTEKPLASRKFPGTYAWGTEWANYNGDERALTSQQIDLCKKKPASPPPPQELFIEFTRPIFDQLKSFLRNYYKNT
ncbi:MAG: hypothetical protein V2A67_03190 [Bacteroidota bacterium]